MTDLPPLPEFSTQEWSHDGERLYTESQMRAYALAAVQHGGMTLALIEAAVLEERERCAVLCECYAKCLESGDVAKAMRGIAALMRYRHKGKPGFRAQPAFSAQPQESAQCRRRGMQRRSHHP